MGVVSCLQRGEVLEITLNRPQKLNAFDDELIDTLLMALSDASDSGVRLVSFSGEGKGFSGGFDLSNITNSTDGDLVLRFIKIEKLLQAICHASFATIAFVHGPCYGAAADLVAACQWRVATPDALFRMPGVRFGLILGTGRLTRLVGEDMARQLVLRDEPFNAQEALETGFLSHIIETGGWEELKNEVLSKVSGLTYGAFKQLSSQQRKDQCNADMAALVGSAIEGSVKNRILSYLDLMSGKKKVKSNKV
jgi:enoyl-CoA hydratase